MATRVHESAILDFPLWKVWKLVRPLDFVYMPTVATVRLEDDNQQDSIGTSRTVIYNDGTKQVIRLLELSDARHSVTWELLQSEPEAKTMGVIHTVRLRRVTSDESTYIEWKTDFSKDATTEVTEDARYKQRENFAALRKEAAKQFNFHTTAEEVIAGYNGRGKVVLITGANSGIGLECVRVFLLAGCHVIGAVRNPKDSQKIFDPILKSVPKEAKLDLLALDLNSLKSVRSFADSFQSMKIPLHILILNAGIMCIPERTLTQDGIESQFGVNHVAHHLLTVLLLDVVKASSPSRIVVLSSLGHRRSPVNFEDINWEKSYDRWKAYGQSKTANILFAKQLQANLAQESKNKESKVDVFAVHPGSIQTALGRTMPAEDLKMFAVVPYRWKSVSQGAATSVYAAIGQSLQGKGGAYLSDCNEIAPVPHAADMNLAARLWAETEKMIAKFK